MTEIDRNQASEAAVIIAGWPRVWTTLLAEHVEGPDGRCDRCSYGGARAAPVWPCRLAVLAETAQAIHRQDARSRPAEVSGTDLDQVEHPQTGRARWRRM